MMTIRSRPPTPIAARGLVLVAAAFVVAGLVSGCASGQSASSTPAVPQRGPIDTGTYPNLNVPPEVAAQQISDDDRSSLNGRIATAQSRQAGSGRGAGATGDPALLKKLAQSHGDDTLKEIAGQ